MLASYLHGKNIGEIALSLLLATRKVNIAIKIFSIVFYGTLKVHTIFLMEIHLYPFPSLHKVHTKLKQGGLFFIKAK